MLPCHATTNLNTFDFTPQPLLPLKKETYTVYYILYLLLLPARPKTIHCKNSSPPPPPHVLGSVHTLLTKLSCSRCLSVCLVSSPSGQYTVCMAGGGGVRKPETWFWFIHYVATRAAAPHLQKNHKSPGACSEKLPPTSNCLISFWHPYLHSSVWNMINKTLLHPLCPIILLSLSLYRRLQQNVNCRTRAA